MGKPFLTIDGQLELLNRRGVETGPDAGKLLMREGYYNVVNGYKAPFIDAAATRAAGDDRYLPGTTLDDIYALFRFDRSLRERTFHQTLKAEALVRTACAYHFAQAHPGAEDYLLQSSYASEAEYAAAGCRDYVGNMQKLMQVLFAKSRRSVRDPIAHYRDAYGEVPIWILSCDLTFGNMEHFFDFMKPAEQGRVCRSIAESTGRLGVEFYSPKQARSDINTIVKVRNMCAHDERLYCARVGGRKKVGFTGFLKCLRRFLTEDEFGAFLGEVVRDANAYAGRSGTLSHVMEGMGFARLARDLL